MNLETTVLDTGVVVSATLARHSIPRQAVDRAFDLGPVLASVETMAELNEALRRPKFDRYVSEPERLIFLDSYARRVTYVEPHETITACRDPKDNQFLALAVSGNATFIVSGDSDLLVLSPFRNVVIVTPSDFLLLTADTQQPPF